jgi:hypothetical protein
VLKHYLIYSSIAAAALIGNNKLACLAYIAFSITATWPSGPAVALLELPKVLPSAFQLRLYILNLAALAAYNTFITCVLNLQITPCIIN